MSDEILSGRQKVALCAALGAGVVVGATGLVIYQRLNHNVGLKVIGPDFSQEIATLTTHIDLLRQDIELLKGNSPDEVQPLKSVLKKSTKYDEQYQSHNGFLESSGDHQESIELPGIRRKRTSSWGSGLTNGSASSSGTEYFSAVSDDDEDLGLTFSTSETTKTTQGLGYEETELVEFFAKVDDLMEGSQEQQLISLRLLNTSLSEYKNNPSFLWRLCKSQYLCSVLVGQDGDKDRKKELILEAINTGEQALKLNANNSEAHKWYAIALGSRGEFSGVKEKILDGFEFKKHIDLSAQLNPHDHITHHLLGRFCYEVSQLSWIERKMAATLFADPPSASLPEAIDHFVQAEKFKPDGWKENRLFIAKCHIGLGDFNTAMIWLDKADSIPLTSLDVREGIKDKVSQQEIDQLLVKYEKYRCHK